MTWLKVVGFDPSMRNWGIASGRLHLHTGELAMGHLDVIQPVKPEGKQTRTNSIDLAVAEQHARGIAQAIQRAQAIFVEVPVGSQSAAAMKSYGMCIGLLGALRAHGTPFFEVTATEVKLAGCGKKTASKAEMIQAAQQRYPDLDWPTYRRKGETLVSESSAEHMADAIFAIQAGLRLPSFQQFRALMAASASPQETAV